VIGKIRNGKIEKGVKMRKINQDAKKVIDKLIEGLGPGRRYKKINNAKGAFMAVVVEDLGGQNISGTIGTCYSVAHYYRQNGDAMRDPEMVFFKTESGDYFPTMYQQDGLGIYRESIYFDHNSERWLISRKEQRDQVVFAGTWMRNIKHQQKL
jgi:uncharacterized protein DUF6908